MRLAVCCAMDWCLLLLSLWLCTTQGKSQDSDQRFYLKVTKYEGDLILEQCKRENAKCLRRGDQDISNLECMCEDEYEEAERLRAECGDGGRNESAVQRLASENLPDTLGFCARAFANLGYRVETVNNVSRPEITTYNVSELEAKIEEITDFAVEFWNLLDRTLVGVYLSSDQQRDICKGAYDEWLCSVSLSLYSNDSEINDSEIKPCLNVCTRVVQQCPYYLPSKFQDGDDDEIIYGGYPVFDCPEVDILIEYQKSKSCGGMSCQAIPYGLDQNCLGRDGTTPHLSCTILVLFISIFCSALAFLIPV